MVKIILILSKSTKIERSLFVKNTMKNFLKDFVLAILAGISIACGCTIYMLCENKIIGAMFFTLGLFLVLTRGYNLFTGKIAYVFDNKPKYILDMIIMWLGNLVGSAITAGLIMLTKLNYLQTNAQTLTGSKLSQTPISAFIMAVFCGMVIYWAVENFKTNSHEIGKYLGLLFLIPFFIICGFEHCVANMMYFILAESFTFKTLIYLLIITLGNTTGSIICRLTKKHLMQ